MTDSKNFESQELNLDQLKDAAGGVTGDGSDQLQLRTRLSLADGIDKVKLDTGSGNERPDFTSKARPVGFSATRFGGKSDPFVE